MKYIIEILTPKHHLESFSSGEDQLDLWLYNHALEAQKKNTSRTYIAHRGDDAVIGFFSFAAHSVFKDQLPQRIGRGSPEVVPVILLTKFALDKQFQGKGLGSDFLINALEISNRISETIGARFVIVDALNEDVAKFYKNFKFVEFVNSPLRLARKVSDLQRDLGFGAESEENGS